MSEKEKNVLESIGGKIEQMPEDMRSGMLQRLSDVATGMALAAQAQANAPSED